MLRDVLEDFEAAGREFQIGGARTHAARPLTRVLGHSDRHRQCEGRLPV